MRRLPQSFVHHVQHLVLSVLVLDPWQKVEQRSTELESWCLCLRGLWPGRRPMPLGSAQLLLKEARERVQVAVFNNLPAEVWCVEMGACCLQELGALWKR